MIKVLILKVVRYVGGRSSSPQSVCGEGWFTLFSLITEGTTGVQPQPAPSPINLTRAAGGCSNQPSPHTLHTHMGLELFRYDPKPR